MSHMMALYTDGKTAFRSLEEALDRAENSIEIQMFIWRDDLLGRRLLAHVETLAERGIQINIRKDLMGVVFELSEESRGSLLHDKVSLKLRRQALILHWFYPTPGKPRRYCLGDSNRMKQLTPSNSRFIIDRLFAE